MATAKHKFQKRVFNPAKQKLVDFLDELQKLAKEAFRIAAHTIIEQFIYAKKPLHLKKSMNQAHLEKGTFEQTVIRLESELELNGLEAPIETNTVRQHATNTNADRPKPRCQRCKKTWTSYILKINVACWKNSQNKLEIPKMILETKTMAPQTLTQIAASLKITTTTTTRTVTEPKESQKLFIHPVKTYHSTEKCYFGANAANRPPP